MFSIRRLAARQPSTIYLSECHQINSVETTIKTVKYMTEETR